VLALFDEERGGCVVWWVKVFVWVGTKRCRIGYP
jgi:hypothetical protein